MSVPEPRLPLGPSSGDGGGRVFLVDGTALLYRAHFAFLRSPLTTSKGEHVSAVYGFASAIFQLLRAEKPRWMAVAFDLGAPTFRHDRYAGYKAHRPPMADELAAQVPRVKELVAAIGLRLVEQEGIEADDWIGTLCRLALEAGREVVIVSSDKDFMQLIGPRVTQWIPPKEGGEGQWVDEAGVQERWGVPPSRMVDLLALMGDSTDNVPGVAGIGERTAASLLQQFGSLDGIYAQLASVEKKSVRERLEKDRENAVLSRELVRIRCDLPPPCDLEDLRVPPLGSGALLVPLLRDLEFRRFLEEIGPKQDASWSASVEVIGTEKGLAAAMAHWGEKRGPLSIDTETLSPGPRPGVPVGIALAWEQGRSWYIPIGPTGGLALGDEAGRLSPETVHRNLAPILADPALSLVGENVKGALHALAALGLEVKGEIRDTLLASYLINPEGATSLDAISQSHLGHRMIAITELTGKGRQQIPFDRVPVEKAAAYAGERADVALRLDAMLEPRLRSQGLLTLWRELECPLVPVLMRMERAGVKVDAEWLRALSVTMQAEIDRLGAEIYSAAETEFNINSPPQLAQVLFDRLRLPSRRKTKTGKSTDSEVLEELALLHPVPRLVLEYRRLCKLKGTYVDALPALIDPATGRIHASFNQTVAATGRLSSSDPNLQNIPIRSPLGREIRKAFTAEPGSRLVSADYSQIELRVLAHLSGDEGLRAAFRSGADVHAATASRVFGVPPEQVDPAMRARAKVVNFGVIYGMGAPRLARELSITPGEARSFIEAYFARMPGVKGWIDETLSRARADGYVSTLFGRRRPAHDLNHSDGRLRAQAERIATNTPIQGTAADLIKRAMLEVDRALGRRGLRTRMILQVHDELVLEVPEGEAEEAASIVRRAMEGAAELVVPLRVDLGMGSNWAEAHS